MTQLQRNFVHHYIISGNGRQSAIAAGYSIRAAERTACNLLADEEVQEYMREKMKELEDNSIASEKEILEFFTLIMRGKVNDEIALSMGGGVQELVDRRATVSDRMRAAEHMGRCYGMFRDRLDVNGKIGAVIVDDIPPHDE